MLVIGNGESRKDINISRIKLPKIGCNAIIRDYKVEHLVCVDKRMVNEALLSKFSNQINIYTRKDWYPHYKQYNNINVVPKLPFIGDQKQDTPIHWGSGPYAVLLATQLSNNIKLIGFDLYGKNNKTNNIYKDTTNYNTSDYRAVDPRFWIYQIGKVFECFPSIKFVIHQTDTWILPPAWKRPNVFLDSISNV